MQSLEEQKHLCNRLARLKKVARAMRESCYHYIGGDSDVYNSVYGKFLIVASEYSRLKDYYQSKYGKFMDLMTEEEIKIQRQRQEAWENMHNWISKKQVGIGY